MKKIFFYLIFLGIFISIKPLSALVFNNAQMEEINCASPKMQLLYYYLDPNRKKEIENFTFKCNNQDRRYIMPQWIDEELSKMINKKVWKDPEEGELSQAQLWQGSFAILYEFLEITKKTFPPDKGGAGIQPALLIKEYSDIRTRYQMSLDRLYRARVMFDSFDGRGRTMLANMNLILREMESISDAVSSSNPKRYAQSVTAIAVLSQDLFSIILKKPRVYSPPQEESRSKKIILNMVSLLGIILLFFAVKIFFSVNLDKNSKMMEDYKEKIDKWKDSFTRQFIKVKVEYLVFIPAAFFVFLGILSMNLIIFLFMSLFGIFIGLKMPNIFLNTMKEIRGKKVDSQLMDALILMSNALRSGLDIVQGFEMVSKDLLPPISDEFGLVIKNYQLGMTFEKALGVLEERVSSKMLSYMVRAIVLQRQIGGNLTKVFERIVLDIREESKLDEKTKALTAQQKIQSIVVGIVPFVLVGIMFMFQPQTMINFYTSPIGLGILIFCLIWIGIGMKVVAALGKIRV